MEIIRAAVGLL